MPGSIDKDDGRMSMLMSIYRKLDKSEIQFDFVASSKGNITYQDEIENLGGRVFLLPEENLTIHNMRQLISRLLSTKKYKFIHYHSISPWGCVLDIPHRFSVKIVTHSHSAGLSDTCIKQIRNRLFSLNVLFYSDERVAVSPEAGKNLFLWKNFTFIPNTIDPSPFIFNDKDRHELRNKLGYKTKNKVIAVVGHIYKVKNQLFAISVFKKIYAEDNDARLLIIGSGNQNDNEYYQMLRKKIKKENLDNVVKFTGAVSDINQYYSACDEIWITSIFEGLPTVALESQANGLPLFISNKVTKVIKINNNIKYLGIKDPLDWKNYYFRMPFTREKHTVSNFKNSIFSLNKILDQWKKIYRV